MTPSGRPANLRLDTGRFAGSSPVSGSSPNRVSSSSIATGGTLQPDRLPVPLNGHPATAESIDQRDKASCLDIGQEINLSPHHHRRHAPLEIGTHDAASTTPVTLPSYLVGRRIRATTDLYPRGLNPTGDDHIRARAIRRGAGTALRTKQWW